MVSLWFGATVAMASTNCFTLHPMYRTTPVSVFTDANILSEKSDLSEQRCTSWCNQNWRDCKLSGQIWILYVVYICTENKAVGVMKPGHVFTIEPMICEGKRQQIHHSSLVFPRNLMGKIRSAQVAGRTRRGQMVGRQSLATASARPSSNTRCSWRRPAAKSSRVDWRTTAALTSCPKCRMARSHQPYSAVEDTTAPPHVTDQPITLWFSVGQEMIGHVAVSADLGRRWRFVNFWMCHLTVTFNSAWIWEKAQAFNSVTLSTWDAELSVWVLLCVCLSQSVSCVDSVVSFCFSVFVWLARCSVRLFLFFLVSHWSFRCNE